MTLAPRAVFLSRCTSMAVSARGRLSSSTLLTSSFIPMRATLGLVRFKGDWGRIIPHYNICGHYTGAIHLWRALTITFDGFGSGHRLMVTDKSQSPLTGSRPSEVTVTSDGPVFQSPSQMRVTTRQRCLSPLTCLISPTVTGRKNHPKNIFKSPQPQQYLDMQDTITLHFIHRNFAFYS